MDNSYPIFDVEQVQKDLQAGITDRVYVVVVDGLNPYDWTDNFFAYTFRLTGSNSPAQQTEGWVQDSTRWWWRNADGSYPVNTWKEIDGKQYYFGSDGYMLSNTYTPDGYFVGLDGAWIESGNSESQELEIPEGVTEQEWQEWLEFEKELLEASRNGLKSYDRGANGGRAGYDNTGEINIGGGY